MGEKAPGNMGKYHERKCNDLKYLRFIQVMYSKLFIGIVYILISYRSNGHAQNTFEKEFDFQFQTSGKAIAKTNDGGYIVGGSNSSSPWVSKVNSKGQIQWAKSIGNREYGVVGALSVTTGGFCYASGSIFIRDTMRGFLLKFDSLGNTTWMRILQNGSDNNSLSLCGLSACDGGDCIVAENNALSTKRYLYRIDSGGNVVWELTFPLAKGEQFTHFCSVIRFDDSSFIILGFRKFSRAVVSLMRIDLSGSILWSKDLSTSRSADLFGQSICKTSEGGFVVCGHTEGGNKTTQSEYVAKFDSAGSLIWGKEIDILNNGIGFSLAETPKGEILVAGYSQIPFIDTANAMLIQLSKGGNIEFVRTLSDPIVASIVNAAAIGDDGNVVMTGSVTNSFSGFNGVLLMKVDSQGAGCYFENQFYAEQLSGIVTDDTTGATSGGFLDTSGISIGADLTFKEVDLCSLSSVVHSFPQERHSSISPNPLADSKELTIHVTEELPEGLYSLSLFDILGNAVQKEKIILSGAKEDVVFDMPECSAGAYIIELQSLSDPSIHFRAKFIKQN